MTEDDMVDEMFDYLDNFEQMLKLTENEELTKQFNKLSNLIYKLYD